MLKEHLRFDEETERFLKTSHLRPRPRIWEGQFLLRHGVRAAIDISDGLVSDLSKLCKASGVEAEVRAHKVPVHPLVKAAFRSDCVDSALFGGEDYELLFTAPAQTVERIKEELPCPITTIGKVMEGEPGRVGLVDEKGNTVERDKSGWNHFPRNP
jgi:thiamine-monophosphate kinase